MIKTSKRSISPSEYELIEKLSQSGMTSFSADEAAKLVGWNKSKAYKICGRLKRKGLVKSLNGRYALTSIYSNYDMYCLASNLVWPSYISFWTALNYYKFNRTIAHDNIYCNNKTEERSKAGK